MRTLLYLLILVGFGPADKIPGLNKQGLGAAIEHGLLKKVRFPKGKFFMED